MYKVERDRIGHMYAVGFFLSILGLATGLLIPSILGPVVLIWTFWSDDDDLNHVDPDGTSYMDRDGRPVGGAEKESL